MPAKFQFKAKRLYVTYSQANGLTKERIRDFFVGERGASYYTIGRESHQDGGIHFHALIQWTEAYGTCDERAFDIDGYHPNISGVRSIGAVYKYCTKEDDVLSNFQHTGNTSIYGEIVLATDAEQFWSTVERLDPRNYVLNRQRLEHYANWRYGDRREYTPNYTQFKNLDWMDDWIFSELQCPQKGKWSGGAPVPCLPIYEAILSCLLSKIDQPLLSLLGSLDWERLNGQGPWVHTCISADCSTWTIGMNLWCTWCWTTLNANIFPNGNAFWDASENLYLQTSTERNKPCDLDDLVYGYATQRTIPETEQILPP